MLMSPAVGWQVRPLMGCCVRELLRALTSCLQYDENLGERDGSSATLYDTIIKGRTTCEAEQFAYTSASAFIVPGRGSRACNKRDAIILDQTGDELNTMEQWSAINSTQLTSLLHPLPTL